jgi:hypothetical protein
MPRQTRKKNYRDDSDKNQNKNNKKLKQDADEGHPTSPVEKDLVGMELDTIRETYSVTEPLNTETTPIEPYNATASTSKGKGREADVNQANDVSENQVDEDALSIASSTENYTFVSRAKSFPAKIPEELIAGKSHVERKNECSRIFSEFSSFTGCAAVKIPNDKGENRGYIRIFFSNEKERDAATQVKLSNTETRFERELDSDANRRNYAACSVRVTQIPLNIAKQAINNAFSKYGKITQIQMSTRNAWQSAIVTFDNADVVQQFNTTWGIYILQDMVTVTPLNATREVAEKRSLYCLRLTGLPQNTNARDLDEIGKTQRNKTVLQQVTHQ